MRVALLLSAQSFESFFGDELGLTPDAYVDAYRNDWAWDYCSILREHGVEATIYVPSVTLDERRVAPDGFAVRFLRLGRAYRPWLRLPVLRRTPWGRWASQYASGVALRRPLDAGLDADGIDVLLVQEYWHGRFDALALRPPRPVVAVDQGIPDRREVRVLKRRAMARARAIVTQTRAEADKVRRHGGRAVHAPNAVDTDFFSPARDGEPRERWTAMTLARLHDPQKRISDLLRALARTRGPWTLDLYGSGPDEDRLRALTAELGLGDRVRFLGFVADKVVVRDRLRRVGAFVLPSAWEGLPVALLEAMACGAPAVGTDIPAIAEVIEQGGGRVVPVGRPDLLAAALDAAGEDMDALGRQARATVEHGYSRERLGRELTAVLRAAAEA